MSMRISSGVSEFAFVRHRMTYRLALILAIAAAWTAPIALTAAEVPRTTVTVRVYQAVALPSAVEQRALTEAETVLRAAHVNVRWRTCSGPTRSAACDEPPGPAELFLRVVRKGMPRLGASATLGDALVVRRAGGSVLATVYVDNVAWLATVAETDVAVLLGRVAAHELGHLIMQTTGHARHGLMRQNWTPREVRRNRASDWVFAAVDVAAMREPKLEY